MNNQILDDLKYLKDSQEPQKSDEELDFLKLRNVLILVLGISLALFFVIRYFVSLWEPYTLYLGNNYIGYFLSVLGIGTVLIYHYILIVTFMVSAFFTSVVPFGKRIRITKYKYIYWQLMALLLVMLFTIVCLIILEILGFVLYFTGIENYLLWDYLPDFVFIVTLILSVVFLYGVLGVEIDYYYKHKKDFLYDKESAKSFDLFKLKTIQISVFVIGFILFAVVRHYAILGGSYYEVFDMNAGLAEKDLRINVILIGAALIYNYGIAVWIVIPLLLTPRTLIKIEIGIFSLPNILIVLIAYVFFLCITGAFVVGIVLSCFIIFSILGMVFFLISGIEPTITSYTPDLAIVVSLIIMVKYGYDMFEKPIEDYYYNKKKKELADNKV